MLSYIYSLMNMITNAIATYWWQQLSLWSSGM